jgi:hypothetical protein
LYDQRASDEMERKGWTTVQVKAGVRCYYLIFFTPVPLGQDLQQTASSSVPCIDDNDLVVVSELTEKSVAESVTHLLKTDYFHRTWPEEHKPDHYGYEIPISDS